ncbi:enoyl-CoA hydratase/isomerase family protein [Neobacillus sp. NRS-1170]|uniref:enoyl-CoA hydratase/isomerase family protein n=1 Tax=Neobacillus sp. NRS-1170 TaxID=3233898 RepID=UPI003D27B8FF
MSKVFYKIENGVGIIILNRPEKLNAFNDEMLEQLIKTVTSAIQDSSVHSIILTGEGRAFSSGGDVINAASRVNDVVSLRKKMEDLTRLICELCSTPKPVISAINGSAIGAGLGLALTGDLIVASTNAIFSAPFLRIGLVADGGVSYLATRRIGTEKTKRLLLTNETINAKTANEWGLVDWIVEPEELLPYSIQLAERLAQSSKSSVGMIKSIMNNINNLTMETALEQEMNTQIQSFLTDEHKQRVKELVEKMSKKTSLM